MTVCVVPLVVVELYNPKSNVCKLKFMVLERNVEVVTISQQSVATLSSHTLSHEFPDVADRVAVIGKELLTK
ncbi:hypothetical protein EB796_009441 [Bugula neritina]|uniref:Uncharacterized protein n=1 Tax=Bugula neritina TaxID=10212 RepID=A0A7J7K271_BUGNE|nr:hypothetical protein EB796_009441 [Bugula neritina]